MLEGGEDPRFIVRRMVILASEDIGNADPAALGVAMAAAQAVEHVGMPEAKFALAQAAIYLSLAPKSNVAGRALGAAQRARARAGRRAGTRVAALVRPGQRRWRLRLSARPPGAHLAAGAAPRGGDRAPRFYEPDEAEAALAERLEEVRRARGAIITQE